jgi:hypothetical protein
MRRSLWIAAVVGMACWPLAAAAAEEARLRVDIVGEDGAQVHLDLSAGWLKGWLEFADIDCKAEVDAPTRAMAASLAAQGEGGFYEFDQADGDHVLARRARGELRLEVRDDDRERSVVEMPWTLAECWLLGREPRGGLGRVLARDGLHVRVESHDGADRLRLSLD